MWRVSSKKKLVECKRPKNILRKRSDILPRAQHSRFFSRLACEVCPAARPDKRCLSPDAGAEHASNTSARCVGAVAQHGMRRGKSKIWCDMLRGGERIHCWRDAPAARGAGGR